MSTESEQPDAVAITLSEALAFLSRRKWVCLAFAVPMMAASVLVAFSLPEIYESQATILIEQQTIPEDLVSSSVDTYVDEQIQVVTQRVLSTANIRELIERFDLYSDSTESGLDAIGAFRSDTDLSPIVTGVSDDRGRPGEITFGFTISYPSPVPETAQEVTAALAELYLSENIRARTERAAQTTRFLERESERILDKILQKEHELADFKSEYGDAMPDQTALNMQTLDRVERELEEARQDIINNRRQRDLLASELATMDPYATIYSESGAPILSSAARLEELRREYAQLIARYGEEHPDVLRVRREIASLSSGTSPTRISLEPQISALESELARYRDRGYSNEHPDVRRVQSELTTLRQQRTNQPAQAESRPPDNPDYLQKQVQLASARDVLSAAEARLAELQRRQASLERRLAIAPRVEQDWLSLNRDYENLRREYDEISRRTTEAKLSERLEEENQGDRFTLINAANLPDSPIAPNRPAIIFLGMIIALGGAVGLAILLDAMDLAVRGARDLFVAAGMKPVAILPYIPTRRDRISHAARLGFGAAAVSAIVIVLYFVI